MPATNSTRTTLTATVKHGQCWRVPLSCMMFDKTRLFTSQPNTPMIESVFRTARPATNKPCRDWCRRACGSLHIPPNAGRRTFDLEDGIHMISDKATLGLFLAAWRRGFLFRVNLGFYPMEPGVASTSTCCHNTQSSGECGRRPRIAVSDSPIEAATAIYTLFNDCHILL